MLQDAYARFRIKSMPLRGRTFKNAESLLSQITEELISGKYEAYGLEVHKILGVISEVYRTLAP